MPVAVRPLTPPVLANVLREMKAAQEIAWPNIPLGDTDDGRPAPPPSPTRDATSVMIDVMRDGVVTKNEAEMLSRRLTHSPANLASLGVLLKNQDVTFAQGSREALVRGFAPDLTSSRPSEDGLSPRARNRLASRIDDAQWNHERQQSPIGTTDDSVPVPPRTRWVGETKLTTAIVAVVSDGYLTKEKAAELEGMLTQSPVCKVAIAALLQSSELQFLPGTKRLLQEAFR